MKNRELVKLLKKSGYELVRQNKHAIYSNGQKTISIPIHGGKDLNHHLLAGILKQIRTT